ncbi:MAG: hypothetical protein WA547_05785 [Thermoplasmata archaeon]
MAEPRPSPVVPIVLAIIVLAAGIGGIGFLYYEQHHEGSASSGLVVQVGDNVTVNYIGLFANGPQQGRVFDTSEYSIALNNVSWPKSLQYTSRGGQPSDYSPLPVYVGSSAPSGGYSFGGQTFSTVVPGFWQGLVGLPGNRTHYITVPPSLGYSFVNASCLITGQLVTTTPVLVTVPPGLFAALFPNVTMIPGVFYTDPVYGWNDTVLSANASAVTYENLPTLGMTTYPNGWPVVVTNITTSTITLQSQLTPAQAGSVAGHGSADVCGTSTYIVTQVNLGAGTYVADYNQEVAGQTLIFIVSVVDIFPA